MASIRRLTGRRSLAHRCSSRSQAGQPVAVELEGQSLALLRSGSVTMPVNKVHHVTTINLVAADLGKSVDWLHDVANEMDAENGVSWVYGVGDDQVMALTDFGIENLIDLIKIGKDDPTLLKRFLPKAGGMNRAEC
jgi:hypothetical protein